MEDEYLKKTNKKIIGAFMVAIIVVTIGAVLVSADTDETGEEKIQINPWGFWGRQSMCFNPGGLFYELTDEQEEVIMQLKETMIDEGATCEEVRVAIMEKLDEWGILDNRLDNAIEQTELRLNVLNRQKELREQGYSWEEIQQIIQDEFELEEPFGFGMMGSGGFHHGRFGCRGGFYGHQGDSKI